MIGQSAAMFPSPAHQIFHPLRIVDFAPARPPTNIGKQIQPSISGCICQPVRWRNIETNCIHPRLAHSGEIIKDLGPAGEWFGVFVQAERAVGDPFYPKALSANSQKPALDLWPRALVAAGKGPRARSPHAL